jgi:hypothetical protein
MPLKRIPNPNADANAWGTILNEHLAQTHRAVDGGLNTFNTFNERPTGLTADDQGKSFLFTKTGNWHEWSGTTWKVLNSNKINVLDYGAIADGVTNNTVIVQNIINANQGKQYCLYFPAADNTYLFNSKIIFNNAIPPIANNFKPFSIIGDGAEASKLEGKADLIEVNGNINHNFQQFKDQIKIEGLGMITKSTSYTNTCLWIKNAQVCLSDLNINGKWGIAIDMLHCCYSDINRVNSFTWLNSNTELPNNTAPLGSLKGTFLNAVASVANNVRSCQVAGYKHGYFFSKTQYDNHYCEGWAITDSSFFIVDFGIYAEHMTSLNVSGCIFTPIGMSCLKADFGVGIQVINSFLEGDNKEPIGNASLYVGINLGVQTTSCSIIGNQFSGTNPQGRGYILDGNNHSVALNRFNHKSTDFLKNAIYGNGHTVFSNIGKGSENTFSNDYVNGSKRSGGRFSMQGLREYADNNDALTDILATDPATGLPYIEVPKLKIGDIYRTGDFLKIVH